MPGRVRVLLVEDDPGVRTAIHFLLTSAGYEVTAAASLAEAIRELRHDPRADLLVTDYHLTDGETGIQVIASVRKELGKPLKAILMTGDTSTAIKALRPDPLLRIASKPMNAEELLSLLSRLLADSLQA